MTAGLAALIERRAAESPDAPALRWFDTDGKARELTFAGLAGGVQRAAAAAAARGFSPGDAALIAAGNGPGLLCAQLGLMSAGCSALPLDPAHPSFMLRQCLGGKAFRFLAAEDEEFRHRVSAAGLAAAAELPLAPEGGEAPPASGTGELIALTAGSSAMPKAARLSQRALLAAGRGLAAALGLKPGDTYLSFSHLSSPWTLQEFVACAGSGAVFCVAETDPGPERFGAALMAFKPSVVRAHAEVISALMGLGPSRRRDPGGDRLPRAERETRLIVTGGTLQPATAGALAGRGYGVMASYGLTEACGLVSVSLPGAGGHGAPIPGATVSISVAGEVLVSGPALMEGYFSVPAHASPAVLDGPVLRTGDWGRLDAGGVLRFLGPELPRGEGENRGLPGRLMEYLICRDPLFSRALVIGGGTDGPPSSLAVVFPDLEALRGLCRASGIAAPAGDGALVTNVRVLALLKSRVRACLKDLPPGDQPEAIRPDPRHPRINALELCPDLRLRRSVFMTRFAVRLQAHNVRTMRRGDLHPARLHPHSARPPEKSDYIFVNIEIDVLRSWMLPKDAVHRTGVKLEKILSAGIPSLLAATGKAGYTPDYLLYRFCPSEEGPPQMRELAEAVAGRPARIVAVSCFGLTLPFALKTAEEIRRLAPEKKIVFGGCGPSGAAEAIISNCPYVDAVVKGEGELAFPRLLGELLAGRTPEGVPGVTCRDAAGRTVTFPPERIENLDALPMPTFDYMDRKDYFAVGISTMRGCPNSCKYCGNRHMFGAKVAFRSLDSVLGDMETLYREKQKNFFFIIDEIFTLGRERAIEFCSRAEKLFGGKAAWFCYSTVYALDEDLMEAMAACGCVAVYIGVESGSPGVLKHNKRTETEYSIEEAMRKVSLASRYIASVTIFLVVGFREESLHDFLETLRLSRTMTRRGYGSVRIFWLRPIPLTPVFEDNKKDLFVAQTRYHWPPPHHVRWVADLAAKDPALAPWVMLVPSPFVYLKKFLYYYFTSQRSRAEGGRLERLKKRVLGLLIDRLLDATRFMSGVPD